MDDERFAELFFGLVFGPAPSSSERERFPLKGCAFPKENPLTLVECVGRGGNGEVWKAIEHSSEEIIAVKFLNKEGAAAISRFEREGLLLRELEHPNIVQVRRVPSKPYRGHHYMVLEFIDGVDLKQRMKMAEPALSTKLSWLRDVSLAIAAAHSKKVVHGDLSPNNILIDKNDSAFVTDFGLSKQIDPEKSKVLLSQLLATPGWHAPEFLDGHMWRTSDVFVLGLLAPSIFSWSPSPSAALPKDLPTELATIVDQCCDQDANRRPSASQVAMRFEKSLARPTKTSVVLAAVSVLVLVSLSALGYVWLGWGQPPKHLGTVEPDTINQVDQRELALEIISMGGYVVLAETPDVPIEESSALPNGRIEIIDVLLKSPTNLKDLCDRINQLAIHRMRIEGAAFGNTELELIGGLSKVQFLYLSDIPAAEEGLTSIADRMSLLEFGLQRVSIGRVAFDTVSNMRSLRTLSMQECNIADDDIGSLEGSRISNLLLNDSTIGDSALPHLVTINTLEALDVSGSLVSESGLLSLVAKHKGLRSHR